MLRLPIPFRSLLFKSALLIFVYGIIRLLFLLFNRSVFEGLPVSHVLSAFAYGTRFDIVAITIINLPVIFIHLLPERLFLKSTTQRISTLLFFISNIPFILANCIDFGLFRFSARRLTADIFSIMGFGDDFVNTVPKMVADFWPEGIAFAALTFMLAAGHRKIIRLQRDQASNNRPAIYATSLFLISSLAFIGFRGGVQYKPLSILSASIYADGPETPLILNSSFTLIKTFGKDELKRVRFFDDSTASRLAPSIRQYDRGLPFLRKNVVIIILEGIGKEYIGRMNGTTGYTPFLDSLIDRSMVFTEAYANGKRSIEGIPAVCAGIPTLNDQPYISSPYASNRINSVASLLGAYGYNSVFFHGGSNGTMGFDVFSKAAGYRQYFGRNEYANDEDFDGNWGIFDMPFLQRAAVELNRIKPPFTATIFTLTSHHPYLVPQPFASILKDGTLPIHKSVRYTDESLRQFFKTVAAMPWYDSTLFVITADHTALPDSDYYRTRAGIYSIPILFFSPDGTLAGASNRTTQQIDILPGILDLLHYPDPFFSIGSSMFDRTAKPMAVNFLNGTHQLISEGYSYILDTLDHPKLYNLNADPMQQQDMHLKQAEVCRMKDSLLKATLQVYHQSMLDNTMSIERH